MNTGSMAMALTAEYGDCWPAAISFRGSNWRTDCPAADSHFVIGARSAISPMPQLRVEGKEKSGTSKPARRVMIVVPRRQGCNHSAEKSDRCPPGRLVPAPGG